MKKLELLLATIILIPVLHSNGQVLKPAVSDKPVENKKSEPIPASYAGTWKGNLLGQLDIIFHLENTGKADVPWLGNFDVPAQNVQGFDLSNIRFEDGKIQFDLSGVPGKARYEGKIKDDKMAIEGRFKQGLLDQPMVLKKESPVDSKFDIKAIDSLAEKLLAQWKAPGLAVAIVKDGKLVHSAGYGFRNVEKQEKMTPETLLSIGSCTKAFTTAMLASLVDEGKLNWDEPVRGFWPEFQLKEPSASQLVSLRDMVTHRTGLPRHDLIWYAGEIKREDIIQRIPHLQPAAPIRQKWIYNNFMFVAAGVAAEKVTGQTWEELVNERIFKPLDMQRSNFHIAELTKDSDHATGYHANKVKKDGFLVKPYREIAGMAPAGSINSSANEMAKWVAFQLGKMPSNTDEMHLPSKKSVEQLHEPQMIISAGSNGQKDVHSMGYAMGWGVESYRGHRHVEHGGAIDGFVAQVELFPDDNLGIVALVNQSGNGLPGVICPMVADLALGLEPIDWSSQALNKIKAAEAVTALSATQSRQKVAGTKPSHELKDYTGVFANPGYGSIEMKLEGDRIHVRFGLAKFQLVHWHYDQFTTSEFQPEDDVFENKRFQFHMDTNGEMSSLTVDFEPMADPIRFIRQPDARLNDPEFLKSLTGEYELPAQILKIGLQGNRLQAILPGQPVYLLSPTTGTTFRFDGLTGFQMKFILDSEGKPVEVKIEQPNGVFAGKKKQ